MLQLPGHQIAFIIRVRLQPNPDVGEGARELHGSVQLLGEPAIRYFRELASLSRLLREWLEAVDAASPPPESD
jgi:hypothetical protein